VQQELLAQLVQLLLVLLTLTLLHLTQIQTQETMLIMVTRLITQIDMPTQLEHIHSNTCMLQLMSQHTMVNMVDIITMILGVMFTTLRPIITLTPIIIMGGTIITHTTMVHMVERITGMGIGGTLIFN
jgi:hypothetical protein